MSAEEQDTRSGGIQVIARAAELLRVLQAHPGGLSQAEIGERVGMARSTVSRILNALEDEGLVASRGARGPYRLGPEITRMATTVRLGVVTEMHPFLTELSRELDETVDLSILDGDRADVVDQVVPPQRLRAVSAVGESFPAVLLRHGKALLAALRCRHCHRRRRPRRYRSIPHCCRPHGPDRRHPPHRARHCHTAIHPAHRAGPARR